MNSFRLLILRPCTYMSDSDFSSPPHLAFAFSPLPPLPRCFSPAFSEHTTATGDCRELGSCKSHRTARKRAGSEQTPVRSTCSSQGPRGVSYNGALLRHPPAPTSSRDWSENQLVEKRTQEFAQTLWCQPVSPDPPSQSPSALMGFSALQTRTADG